MSYSPDNKLVVDLGSIRRNLKTMRGVVSPGLRVAAVVKADAYGHGMIEAAQTLRAAGAEFLAVAFTGEGAALRWAGDSGPILIMTGIRPKEAEEAVAQKLTPFVFDLETCRALDGVARATGRLASCHLKVDTGMGRLGVAPGEVLPMLDAMKYLKGLEVTGLASHLATAGDPASDFSEQQAKKFSGLLKAAREAGYPLQDSSLTPSGAVMHTPPSAPEPPSLVRLGISLYGGLPFPGLAGKVSLEGAMRFSSRVLAVKQVSAGSTVSYGRTWTAPADTRLAILPVGYSDGLPRSVTNRGKVLIGGRELPLRGTVCMNMVMAELAGGAPDPAPGEEAVLLGRQGRETITVDELAFWAGTIPYEITCSLGAANPKTYLPA